MNTQPAAVPAPGKANLRLWTLRVVDALDAEPNMRRVVFTADDIAEFDYRKGQAIVFAMPLGNGETGRRHYTIRGADRAAGTIWVDFFRHGSSPSVDWTMAARAGDTIEARGPRGGAWFRPDAAWHLITADETGIPAVAHMLETMPASARGTVLIAVADRAHRLQLAGPAGVDVVWLDRIANVDATLAAIERWVRPAGHGHAILMGETGAVRAQRHALIARGLDRQQISSEGYWRAGRIGGHDHVDD
jgi:NADPH-dependent ferric siderophore reductase